MTKTIVQYGKTYTFPPERVRPSARALIIKDGKILLTHEKNTGVYMSPGGGLEIGETLEECCKRELREETGYEISVKEPFISVDEYSFETLYKSNYFICEITGECEQSLTEIETEHGAVPVWLDVKEAMEIFSHYGKKREDIMSLYLREYTVLCRLFERE